jgi:hypothetical protein
MASRRFQAEWQYSAAFGLSTKREIISQGDPQVLGQGLKYEVLTRYSYLSPGPRATVADQFQQVLLLVIEISRLDIGCILGWISIRTKLLHKPRVS